VFELSSLTYHLSLALKLIIMSSVYSIKIFYDLPLQTVLELPLVKLPVLVSPFLARQSSPEKNSANVMCPGEGRAWCSW
jgi:hypothetical protein